MTVRQQTREVFHYCIHVPITVVVLSSVRWFVRSVSDPSRPADNSRCLLIVFSYFT